MGPVPRSFQLQDYLPSGQQEKANALSRHSYLAPRHGDSTFDNQKQEILGPAQVQAMLVSDTPLDSRLIDTIRCREDFQLR